MICTRLVIASVFLCLLLPNRLLSQENERGLDFLNISPSASLLALSEAQTATPAGPSAIYSNPGLLALEESSGLDINYTLWVADVKNQFAAINLRSGNSAFAFGVYSSGSEDVQGQNNNSTMTGYFSFSGAFSYKFRQLSFGVAAQYLREDVLQYKSNGYAINTGVVGEFLDSRLRLGIAILNIGRMKSQNLDETELPTTLRAGIHIQLLEYRTPGLYDIPFLLSLHSDWVNPIVYNPSVDYILSDTEESFIILGMTLEVGEIIELKSGYRFGNTERPYSAGISFLAPPLQVNYSMIPFSTGFNTVHSIGLQYFF